MKNENVMRKIIVMTVVGIVIVALILIIVFMSNSYKQQDELPVPTRNIIQVGYVVRLESNIVNVYERKGQAETYSKTLSEINVYDLPEQTYESLKRGVEIKNGTELARLVEELSS